MVIELPKDTAAWCFCHPAFPKLPLRKQQWVLDALFNVPSSDPLKNRVGVGIVWLDLNQYYTPEGHARLAFL